MKRILKQTIFDKFSENKEINEIRENKENKEIREIRENNENNILSFPKTLTTYLGQKGYTILKNELTEEQLFILKKELVAKPYTPGSASMGNQSVTFPIYRESVNKIYIPRYFGEKYFGIPKKYAICDGENINIQFAGELRDNQKPVVKTFINHLGNEGNENGNGGGLLELCCAFGKCCGINTPIIMYDGTIKMVQDVIIGDLLMGDDSTPRNVLSLARGKETMYKIISMEKGEQNEYIVNESHILSLKYISNHNNFKKEQIIDISVLEYLKIQKTLNKNEECFYGYRVPIHFKEIITPIDPYIIGYWLCSNKSRIPLIFKYNSMEIRLKLLAGIIDGCGHLNNGNSDGNINFQISQKNEKIMVNVIDDIIYVVRSIGIACFKKSIVLNDSNYFVLTIHGKGIENIPTRLPSKIISKTFSETDNVLIYKIKIKKLGVNDYYGFEIDKNRRFVLGDFTVTHNTVLALNIISILKKKTLIIVHKEFLMNQWIERIGQFLPNAKIGKIQGQIIDIENKDIVLGMLQSLSMKEYPATTFNSFGFTIIDEVHHISSEVFSCALFKLVTKYTLGLSATMNRKDGTTKVFKMFLGDVVYKGVRDEEHNVVVRAIEYKVNDDDFNEVKLDFRGNVQYSTMISKLCVYNNRTEFILRVIKDMFAENANQQIMLLAHNKNILKYLHDAISSRNIAEGSVGYYVGGMKEAALKETEHKKIVIATYSMASEALDIKTLTTLIMVTPKTDIEQAVGRILREKHGTPVVVDIIDQHTPFKNQWTKRKQFYKKQNYKIIGTTSYEYNPNTVNWKIIYDSKESKPVDSESTGSSSKCLIKFKKF